VAINYKPHKKQVAAHLAFLIEGYKRGVLLMGRQSGKTYFATNHSWIASVIEQGRYFVVFKTYKQAHEVVWRQYIPLIPKELIYKKNEQDLLIEFHYIKGPVTLPDGTVIEVEHDESKPRSTLQLLGSDQADSHRGFRANGIIFDEYADQDPNNWDSVYKHFFTTTNGWAIFMGTPRGYNHFYDLIQFAKEDERWFYQEATWRDSPYVSRSFIEEERAEATKTGKLSTFLQEVELEFRAIQGAVFPQFDRKIHVIKPQDIPPLDELSIYSGADFGYHTTAIPLVGIDKDQNWYVFDEVYGREEILEDIMPRVTNKLGDNRLILMVGDSAAKDAIETLVVKGWPIVPVVKRQDSIIHGIDLIRQKLKPRIQLVGMPKPTLFFSSACKNIIQEMEAYKYPEDKPERNPLEVPVKENDHGPDALRYLVLHLKYGLQKDDKLPKSSVVRSMNEYGLL
jgi:phage terminase large subunit